MTTVSKLLEFSRETQPLYRQENNIKTNRKEMGCEIIDSVQVA